MGLWILKNKGKFIGIFPILFAVLIWEILANLQSPRTALLFPPFSSVLKELYRLFHAGIMLKNLWASLLRVSIGLICGILFGTFLGTMMGWKRWADLLIGPFISILYPIPALGWLPLLMIWIGINDLLPISVIFLCSFFPVAYNTSTGIKEVDKKLINAARSLGASEIRILFSILLPLALPQIFTGIRIEIGMAWRTIIAAEMVAISTGLGAMLIRAENLVRVDTIIACLMVLSGICFLFERALLKIERKIISKRRA